MKMRLKKKLETSSFFDNLHKLFSNFTFQFIANKTMFHSQSLRDLQLLKKSYLITFDTLLSFRMIGIVVDVISFGIRFRVRAVGV